MDLYLVMKAFIVRIFSSQKKKADNRQLILQVLNEVNDSLANIHTSKASTIQIKDNIISSTDELKNVIEGDKTLTNLTDVYQATASASKSIKKFSSDDVETILSGVLDITESFAPRFGLAAGTIRNVPGTVIAKLMSFINALLGLAGNAGPSIGDIAQYVVSNCLRDGRECTLENKSAGIRGLFETSKAFLDGVRPKNGHLKEHEVSSLSAHVPIYGGVEFMESLGNEIRKLANNEKGRKPKDVLHECRACVRYTTLYFQLAQLQTLLLLDMYTLVKSSEHSDHIADGIWSVQQQRLETAKSTLEFLSRDCHPAIAAINIAENDSRKKAFMDSMGISPSYYSNILSVAPGGEENWVKFQPIDDLSKCMYIRKSRYVYAGVPKTNNLAEFRMEAHGVYWTFESRRWPNRYLSVSDRYNTQTWLYWRLKKKGKIADELTHFIVFEEGRLSHTKYCGQLEPSRFRRGVGKR